MADDAPNPTVEAAAKAPPEGWRTDIQRRIDEAADILAETLVDMWRAKTRAELDGRTSPPAGAPMPAPSEPIDSPGLLKPDRDAPLRRVFRPLDRYDRREVHKLLARTRFPGSELANEPVDGRRHRVMLHLGRYLLGVAVVDEYGDIAVLRAIAVRKTYRRQGHGRALAAHVVRRTYETGVGRVYCVAAKPWFVEEIGFEYRERATVPEDAARLAGIVDAPPGTLVFELTPTKDGHRTPRRMFPSSATELLKMTPDPKPGRKKRTPRSPGAAAEQKRQSGTEMKMPNEVGPKFGPMIPTHPDIGEKCAACKVPFKAGDYTTLVVLGPGPDAESRGRARAGRSYNAVAALVHWACATGQEES